MMTEAESHHVSCRLEEDAGHQLPPPAPVPHSWPLGSCLCSNGPFTMPNYMTGQSCAAMIDRARVRS